MVSHNMSNKIVVSGNCRITKRWVTQSQAQVIDRILASDIPVGMKFGLVRSIGEQISVVKVGNLVVNTGLQAILDKFGEDVSGQTNPGAVYLWLGSGTTAVSASDTDLATFQFEKQITQYIRSGQTATFSTFLNTSEATGFTTEEVGLATGAHGTGKLITRALLGTAAEAKTSNETWTVDYDISIEAV